MSISYTHHGRKSSTFCKVFQKILTNKQRRTAYATDKPTNRNGWAAIDQAIGTDRGQQATEHGAYNFEYYMISYSLLRYIVLRTAWTVPERILHGRKDARRTSSRTRPGAQHEDGGTAAAVRTGDGKHHSPPPMVHSLYYKLKHSAHHFTSYSLPLHMVSGTR